MEAWRWDPARERPDAFVRPSQSPQWQGQPHTVPARGRSVPQSSREPRIAPGLSWSRTGGDLFPALSRPASPVHLPRNLSYKRDFRRSPVPSKSECILGCSKPQSFPGRVPTCLAVLSCESAAFSDSHQGREQTWEWLSAKSCRRTANPVLEGGTGS